MKKILVALTFLSLLFCGSQAYALDTGNAVVTNDTIGSDSGIKAPEFVTNAQGDIVNTPEYKAVLTIINEIKNLSNQTQGNNAIPITEETYQKYNLLYQGAISKLSNAGYDKTKTASAITTLNNAYNSAILTKAGTIDSSNEDIAMRNGIVRDEIGQAEALSEDLVKSNRGETIISYLQSMFVYDDDYDRLQEK